MTSAGCLIRYRVWGRKGDGETGRGSSWRQKTPHRRLWDRLPAQSTGKRLLASWQFPGAKLGELLCFIKKAVQAI